MPILYPIALLQVYVIDATEPLNGLQRVHERVSGVQYFLEHHFGFFYILTNAPMKENIKCSNEGFYLARCRGGDIQSTTWQVCSIRIWRSGYLIPFCINLFVN